MLLSRILLVCCKIPWPNLWRTLQIDVPCNKANNKRTPALLSACVGHKKLLQNGPLFVCFLLTFCFLPYIDQLMAKQISSTEVDPIEG